MNKIWKGGVLENDSVKMLLGINIQCHHLIKAREDRILLSRRRRRTRLLLWILLWWGTTECMTRNRRRIPGSDEGN